MADASVRFSASASQFVPPSDQEESILKMESKRFGKPKTDLHPAASVKYKETKSPLDRTRALPSALQPPGRHPRSLQAGEGNPNAFNPGRVTQRKDPRSFLRSGQGFGGNTTSAVAAAVVDSREAEAKPKPPKAGAFEQRENPPNTELRRFYVRGDLPCIIDQRNVHNKLAWKAKIESLDFHHFLPLFADGLRETEHPYKFLAREGISDLLEFGGNKILPVVPQLIIPLKNALNTRQGEVVAFTCRVIQKLATCDVDIEGGPLVGQALVPYYRQLLPVLNLFHSKNRNLGDEIEYGQRKGENLGDLVQQTLNTLERYGGSDAYINIVYLVPTYESCMT